MLDESSYLSRGIEKNSESSIKRLVLRRCRVGIKTSIEVSVESPEEEILRRRNNTRSKQAFKEHV